MTKPLRSAGVKVGLVGAGRWGTNYLRLGITDFYDPTVSGSLESLDALLDRVDAVVIATPAETHADIAVMCLDLGKDVLVEKPFATTVLDANRILSAQGESIIMVGHLMLYHPAYAEFKRRYEGKPVHSVRMGGRPHGELSPLMSLGSHDLAMLLDLLGSPERFMSVGGLYMVGEVRGTAFSVATSYVSPRIRTFRSGGLIIDRDDLYYEGEFVPLTKDEPLAREFAEFIECCQTRRQPLSDGRLGLEVIRRLI